MRAGFGLVGLLITIGVIVWLMNTTLTHDKAAMESGRKATETVNQISGRSQDGSMRFSESLEIDIIRTGGKVNNILVVDLKEGGPADTFYGLKKDDCIIELGPLSVRDQITSKEEARDFLSDAYQRSQPIVVVRREQKITLPLAPPPKTPNTPATPQQQLESIQKSVGGK